MIARPDVAAKANHFDQKLVLPVQKRSAHTKPETLELKVRDAVLHAFAKTLKKVSRRNFCFETEIQLLRDRDLNFSLSLKTETLKFRSRELSRDLHAYWLSLVIKELKMLKNVGKG